MGVYSLLLGLGISLAGPQKVLREETAGRNARTEAAYTPCCGYSICLKAWSDTP